MVVSVRKILCAVLSCAFIILFYTGCYKQTELDDITTADLLAEMNSLYPDYEFEILDEDYRSWSYSSTGMYAYTRTIYLKTNPNIGGIVTCTYSSSYESIINDFDEVAAESEAKRSIRDLLGADEIIYYNNYVFDDKTMRYYVMTTTPLALTDVSSALYDAGIDMLYAGVSDETFQTVKDESFMVEDGIYYTRDINDFSLRTDTQYSGEADTYREYRFRESDVKSVMIYYQGKYCSIAPDNTASFSAVVDDIPVMLLEDRILSRDCNMTYDAFQNIPCVNVEGTDIDIITPVYTTQDGLLDYISMKFSDYVFTPISYTSNDGVYTLVCKSEVGGYVECIYYEQSAEPVYNILLEEDYIAKYNQ